ncbi:MAG: ABC transporter ATP-binding protein [candidate division NC10 bacterium]|nr:ABC transporter ATP-binding protein [candidate division NC10 bacterium]
MLSVRGLAKSFGGLRAVDGVDLDVRQGEITAIIGPNGAGKTTFFNLISGAFPCDHGRIVFDGEEITNLPAPRLFKRGICRAFQVVNLFPRLTLFENVQAALLSHQGKVFNCFLHVDRLARQETEQVLSEVGLAEKASLVSKNLSHGDQKRLDIAIALAAKPRLLLLDEPTAGLNPKESREIMGLVEGIAGRENLTVIFIEHDMDVVFSVAETIRVMHQGRLIAEGTPQVIKGHPEVRKVYLGEGE